MTAPAARPSRFTKWRPRKWEAMHEQMVVLSTLGRSNIQIAEHFGYTPQHVSNVLNTPEAAIVRRKVLDNLRVSVKSNMDEALEDIAGQAVVRLKQVMYDDEVFEKSPFAVVDRGLAVLKGVGRLKSGESSGGNINFKNAIVLSAEDAKLLKEGAEQSDIAKKINAPTVEVEILSDPPTTD